MNSKFRTILILGILSAIGPFSIDMYLPAFPAIAQDLHTTVAKIALSLSSFFIGISIGQLFYGPILDRFGRKKPLYFGVTIYLLSTIGCSMATSADGLIWLRFFQALGSCSGLVASRAMVRDLFPVEENAKVFSLLMLVIGVSPIIAPTTGGYLTAHLSWRSVFITLTIISAIILIAVHLFLPESRKPDLSFSLRPKAIFKGYIQVMKVPQFYTYACAGSIAAAGLYAYIAGSPQVFMEIFHVTGKQYGWIFAGLATGLITCSQLNTVALKKYSSQQIVIVAQVVQTCIGITLVTGMALHWYGVAHTIALCSLFLCCQGFVFPNTSALSLAPFTRNAGTASALMGCIQLAFGAAMTAIVSMLSNGTAVPMAGVMAGCTISALLILLIGSRIIRTKATQLLVQEECAEMVMSEI